jgi:multidrug resistance efflux pump
MWKRNKTSETIPLRDFDAEHAALLAENDELRARIDLLRSEANRLEDLNAKARVTIQDLNRAKNEADRAGDQLRSAARSARSRGW